ncbi:sulfatase-like hydrolase/transferase [Flavicella marina]|uniref:sulfatase-like hydrolase/transferase n=1 Tax=Flavicella marina TaxID=1475951 RepID=UPI00186B0C06|nr:sulfatase-like hydrolase/transferase [Flavicella marina]
MTKEKGVLFEANKLLQLYNTSTDFSYKEIASRLKLKTTEIKDVEAFSAHKKNVIILSLESFEKGYLSDKMKHLTPNLRRLKTNNDWTYFEVNENEGSKWTSGSLYTTLTGYPAFFGSEHNSIFQTFHQASIPSIYTVFSRLGYKNIYLSKDAKFSGTENMLYALGVDEIIDFTSLGDSSMDKDLFEIAKNIVVDQKNKNENFTLFLSTLSTHNPDGIYDDRMEKYINPQKSDLEFMVASVDYMVADFLAFLEKNNFLDSTQIYIIPDHLKHGSPEIFYETGERGLYLLTNSPKNKTIAEDSIKRYQLDLPKMILDLSGIDHNISFLSEQVDEDLNLYVENNITELTKLNISGFSGGAGNSVLIPKLSDKYDQYKKDTLRFIAHAGGAIDGLNYTNSLEAMNNSYEKGFRLFEIDFRSTSDDVFVAVHDWDEWKAFTSHYGEVPVSLDIFLASKIANRYTPLDINLVNKWFAAHPDAVLITDKVNSPKKFVKEFQFKNRLMMELFTWEAVHVAKENNIEPIVSENLIFSDEHNILKKLKELNIKYVAMSRKSLAKHTELFKNLRNIGVKVYAYHINEKIDKDEVYAVKYEMDYYYGIYADDWDFGKMND